MRFLLTLFIVLLFGIGLSAQAHNTAAAYPKSNIATAYATDNTQSFTSCPEHFWQGQVARLQAVGGELFELCFYGFAVLYSGDAKTALYTAHHLTRDEVYQARKLSRIDSFRPESRLPRRYQASLADYRGSGYDRGHLVPNGDMHDVHAQYDSFSLANITPQDREHNRGVWQQIERHIRGLAINHGEVYVITGTVFYNQNQRAGEVLVPTHLYKAVYIPSRQMAAVYYSPNSAANEYELISLAELTHRTGVTAFFGVSDAFEHGLFVLEGDGVGEQAAMSWWSWLVLLFGRLWQQLG